MEKNKRKPHFDYYVVSLTLLATKNPEKKNPKNSNQISQSVSWVLDKVQFSVISNPRRRTIYYSKFSFIFSLLSQHPDDCIQRISRLIELGKEQYLEPRDWPRRSIGRKGRFNAFADEKSNAFVQWSRYLKQIDPNAELWRRDDSILLSKQKLRLRSLS